jgi:hypothetical protein
MSVGNYNHRPSYIYIYIYSNFVKYKFKQKDKLDYYLGITKINGSNDSPPTLDSYYRTSYFARTELCNRANGWCPRERSSVSARTKLCICADELCRLWVKPRPHRYRAPSADKFTTVQARSSVYG